MTAHPENPFDLAEDKRIGRISIWASVARYSFYYVGNRGYWDLWGPNYKPWDDTNQPRADGLKQYLNKDVKCNYSDGHVARRGYHFSGGDARMAFDTSAGAYNDLPDSISASRPILNMDLPWDLIGYVDADPMTCEPHMTASITMSGTESGIFIHNGLSPDASDRMKGYISAALAIEEARAYLRAPAFLNQTQGNLHGVAFSVSTLAGGWGESQFPDTNLHCRYVDLMLTVSNHYENYT